MINEALSLGDYNSARRLAALGLKERAYLKSLIVVEMAIEFLDNSEKTFQNLKKFSIRR